MASDLLVSEFEEETVILNLADGLYYGLDHVGARIWNLIQRSASLATIRDTVAAEYGVAPDRCERDLRDLIEDLAARGLVEIGEGR